MNKIQLSFFLDLIAANKDKAYVSVMNVSTRYKKQMTRTEVFLQNVGRVCVYTAFEEYMDEEYPTFNVSYKSAIQPKVITFIRDKQMLDKAIKTVQLCKQYMENNVVPLNKENDIAVIAKKNQDMLDKEYNKGIKNLHNIILRSVMKRR